MGVLTAVLLELNEKKDYLFGVTELGTVETGLKAQHCHQPAVFSALWILANTETKGIDEAKYPSTPQDCRIQKLRIFQQFP